MKIGNGFTNSVSLIEIRKTFYQILKQVIYSHLEKKFYLLFQEVSTFT